MKKRLAGTMDMVVLQMPGAPYKRVKWGEPAGEPGDVSLEACPGLLGQLAKVRVSF